MRREKIARTITPPITGSSTVWTMETIIEPADTSMYDPASHSVSTGVRSGASSVDTVVTETERATSPFARYVTTFDAVPPGAQPTRITPIARAGGSPSICAMSHPARDRQSVV